MNIMLMMISSMLITAILLSLTTIILLFKLIHGKNHIKQQRKPPPSPWKLPILGNLHQLSSTLPSHLSLYSLSKKYGPLMLLQLGQVPTLVVSSKASAQEVLKTNDLAFASRFSTSYVTHKFSHGEDMSFGRYGEYWRHMRRICIVGLLSAKKVASFARVREEELRNMMQKISSSSSQGLEINLSELALSLSCDIISRVAMGRKYNKETEGGACRGFKGVLEQFLELFSTFNVGDYIPYLAWIGRFTGLVSNADKCSREWDHMLEVMIKEHTERPKPHPQANLIDTATDGPKDLIEVLLEAQKKENFTTPITTKHIKAIISDMLAGGSITSASVVEWTMSELLLHPEIMERVKEELTSIANGKPYIKEDELHQLNYLKAVIKETMRLHPPVLLIPRESIQDVKVQGYDVAANTNVVVNVWAIGRDPLAWEEPEVFKPERFIKGVGRSTTSQEEFSGYGFDDQLLLAFGAGRRVCPGKQYANASVMLALADILHSFDWKVPEGRHLDMEEASILTNQRKSPLVLLATPSVV